MQQLQRQLYNTDTGLVYSTMASALCMTLLPPQKSISHTAGLSDACPLTHMSDMLAEEFHTLEL